MKIRSLVFFTAAWLLCSGVAIGQSQSVHRPHLKWMVPQLGQWSGTATMGENTFDLDGENRWALKRNFIRTHFVAGDDHETMEIIGWDSVNERVQRWVFMSDGTIGEAFLLSRSEAERVWDTTAVMPDGNQTAYRMVIKPTIEEDRWSQKTYSGDGTLIFSMDVTRKEKTEDADEESEQEVSEDQDVEVNSELAFLKPKVGNWRGEFEYSHAGQKSTLRAISTISWVLDNHFQLTQTRFLRDGTNTGSVWVITGWDPSLKKVRSWMATSWGNHSKSTLVKLQGSKQEWESVDVSATGTESTFRDVIKLSADGSERTHVRTAEDGTNPFTLKLKRRKQ